MRHRAFALMVAAFTALAGAAAAPASAQDARPMLGADSREQLQQLGLRRSKDFALDLPLSAGTRRKLIDTDDKLVIDQVLKAQSALTARKLEDDALARTRLVALSRAANPELDSGLASAGLSRDRLLESARMSLHPQDDLRALPPWIHVDGKGRIVIDKSPVFVTNPADLAPDSAPARPLVTGARPVVYRQGLRYAGLLADITGGQPRMQCSGVVIAKYWLVTAAHCLLNEATAARYTTAQVAVFMPLQGGSETVVGLPGENKGMRRIAVAQLLWIGDTQGIPFPATSDDFQPLIQQGLDLALLRLDARQMDGLPNPLADVRLYKGVPPATGTSSVVGYGISDKAAATGMTLQAGTRDGLPNGADNGSDALQYGKPGSATAGICGGDSGGGLFLGRIDGSQQAPQLIGVISGLVADVSSSAQVCMASTQMHASLLSDRNRAFICARAASACG